MGRLVYKWIIVFENGYTVIHEGETPSDALDNLDYEEEYGIVSVVRVGY